MLFIFDEEKDEKRILVQKLNEAQNMGVKSSVQKLVS